MLFEPFQGRMEFDENVKVFAGLRLTLWIMDAFVDQIQDDNEIFGGGDQCQWACDCEWYQTHIKETEEPCHEVLKSHG